MPYCLTTKHFWLLKLCQPPTKDVVLVGNSRVYLGLSPLHMAKACVSADIFNFGFVACSLNRRYLEHAAGLLDPASPNPTLVLGLCPHLLVKPGGNNGYDFWASQEIPERRSLLRQIWRDNFSGKALIKTSARNLLNLSRGLPLNLYYADGWEASLPVRKPSGRYVKVGARLVQNKQVNPRMVDDLLEVTSEFHQRGITVLAYRPPSAAHLCELEENYSGLDFDDFARRFRQAGGQWLHINPRDYQTYDGAHLDFRNAARLSQEIGKALSIYNH